MTITINTNNTQPLVAMRKRNPDPIVGRELRYLQRHGVQRPRRPHRAMKDEGYPTRLDEWRDQIKRMAADLSDHHARQGAIARARVDSTPKSPHETRVVQLRMQGHSYAQIADQLGITKKQVDNALARVNRTMTKTDRVVGNDVLYLRANRVRVPKRPRDHGDEAKMSAWRDTVRTLADPQVGNDVVYLLANGVVVPKRPTDHGDEETMTAWRDAVRALADELCERLIEDEAHT